ncbi:competence/damage-inducible protein A [Flavobacterium sp. NST-5]|uniref:CinA-like protein n=1 Tax=Flavobacterium ichthyis TaxID=2698827 RepID=A0ABW9ZAF1_9FLAO|nr:competence/damage-inducible protein A [Flavobacterium ichthyis]NBL65888.1 competence/damage-inducible protein A [Flavobacterium ichthyis]
MKATIVTIGDEILIGQIVDTNSSFIAKSLDKIGIEVAEMLSISDDRNVILNTFNRLQNKTDLVLITGGLGPTKDDVTKKTFCDYFQDQLISDPKVLDHVTQLIEGYYKRPITQLNIDQALVPSKCTVLYNPTGTAPGMWMLKEKTVFISLPGVPYEMKYLMENEVIPKISREYKRNFIVHKNILTYGQGESLVAERIENWENNLPNFIKLAYLPSLGRVKLRLSARGENETTLHEALNQQISALNQIIGDIIIGYNDNDSLEKSVATLLTDKKFTLAVAESCTGGLLAQKLTAIPGSSKFFKGGAVTYATESKISVLAVNPQTIEKKSVVSQEVAEEMANGAKKVFQSSYALSTTGNAGPTKGDSDAEVGTVFIALSTPEKTISKEFNFGKHREIVIERATNKALEMLKEEILKNL